MNEEQGISENKLLASPMHTIILILILIVFSALSASLNTGQEKVSSKIPTYISMLILEWGLLFYIWRGLKRNNISIASIIFNGAKHKFMIKDLWIALLFWIAANIILNFIQFLLGMPTFSEGTKAVLPQTSFEIIMFFLLAISAGFCEEIVFRGYLQKQFKVLLKNAWAGIIVQALVFGISHGYQGYKSMFVIFIYGILFGLLVHSVKNLKPAIISHSWHDVFNGILLPIFMR